jgi:hypothetical protein
VAPPPPAPKKTPTPPARPSKRHGPPLALAELGVLAAFGGVAAAVATAGEGLARGAAAVDKALESLIPPRKQP